MNGTGASSVPGYCSYLLWFYNDVFEPESCMLSY